MSRQQQMRALEAARVVINARAQWRSDLADAGYDAGRQEVAIVLRQHADGITSDALEMALRLPVISLIAWVPQISEQAARKLAKRAGATRVAQHHGLTVGELTCREALVLAEALDPKPTNEEDGSDGV